MYTNIRYYILLKNFKFSKDYIKINKDDEIELLIGKNEFYCKNNIKQNNYIILQIMNENEDEEELDTSNKLYYNQKYCYKFTKTGNYFMTVLNYPNLYFKVNVIINNKSYKYIENKTSFNLLKNTNINFHKPSNYNEYLTNKNDLPINNKKSLICKFSKIIKSLKINKKRNSWYNIYDINKFEFNKKNNLKYFIENFCENEKIKNINLHKDLTFNDIDDKYLKLIIK